MTAPLLKGLTEEKIVLLKPDQVSKLAFLFKGIVRLVDGKGNTLGLVLDNDVIEEIQEDIDASSPEFLASLEASRRSGRISGKEVKKNLGMK